MFKRAANKALEKVSRLNPMLEIGSLYTVEPLNKGHMFQLVNHENCPIREHPLNKHLHLIKVSFIQVYSVQSLHYKRFSL